MIHAPQTPSSLAIAKVNKLTVAEVTDRPDTELVTVATMPIHRCPINKWPVTIPMLRVSGTAEGEIRVTKLQFILLIFILHKILPKYCFANNAQIMLSFTLQYCNH